MGCDKEWYHFLGVKNWQTLAALWACALPCNKKKISRAEGSWTNPLNALQWVIRYFFIKFCIYRFSLWYEFFVHNALRVEKSYQHVLDAEPLEFQFLRPRGVSPTHSEFCRLVSGSQAKHQVSSPVIIWLKKFLSASAIAIMPCQDVTRSSFCQGVKECGIKRAHNILFPKSSFRIRRTTALGMFKDSAIILDVIRMSFLTKLATVAMFTSVRVYFGRPPLSSSSTGFLLSRNRECQHLIRSQPYSY